jgi:hypothetical protein
MFLLFMVPDSLGGAGCRAALWEERRDSIKRHSRIRPLTSDSAARRASTPLIQFTEIREEPSVIMEIPSKVEISDQDGISQQPFDGQ